MINLELNACMGGMSEGFRRAGVHFDMAVDYDEDACESHERNIGLRPIQMDIRDLLRMARIGAFRPAVRLFVADPPCTPWSMAGDRKGLDDERDLLRETIELIAILRPTAWLIGNVPGLDKAENWEQVVEPVIYEPMREAGYCVDYASFNAADYGTPQCRIRPFWFGHSAGYPCIRWAAPTHARPPVLPGIVSPWVSCGEALEAAFGPRESWGPEVGRSVRLRRRAQNSPQHGSVEASPARTVGTSNLSDGNVVVDETKRRRAGKKPRASDPSAPAGVVTSKQNQGDGSVLMVNDKHPQPSLEETAPTVRSGGRGHSAPQTVLTYDDHHRPSSSDHPAMVVRSGSGSGARTAVALREPNPNLPPADPGQPHRAVTRARDQAILADEMHDAGLLDRPSTVIGTAHAAGTHRPAGERRRQQRHLAERASTARDPGLPQGLARRRQDQDRAHEPDRSGDAAAAERGGGAQHRCMVRRTPDCS